MKINLMFIAFVSAFFTSPVQADDVLQLKLEDTPRNYPRPRTERAGYYTRPSTWQAVFGKCESQIAGFDDYVACPVGRRYKVAGGREFKPTEALAVIAYDFGLDGAHDFKKVKDQDVIAGQILNSIRTQAAGLDNFDDTDMLKLQARFNTWTDGYEKAVRGFLTHAVKRGWTFYVAKGYWGPSVTAQLLVMINKEKGSATIIAHGHTDG